MIWESPEKNRGHFPNRKAAGWRQSAEKQAEMKHKENGKTQMREPQCRENHLLRMMPGAWWVSRCLVPGGCQVSGAFCPRIETSALYKYIYTHALKTLGSRTGRHPICLPPHCVLCQNLVKLMLCMEAKFDYIYMGPSRSQLSAKYNTLCTKSTQ